MLSCRIKLPLLDMAVTRETVSLTPPGPMGPHLPLRAGRRCQDHAGSDPASAGPCVSHVNKDSAKTSQAPAEAGAGVSRHIGDPHVNSC